MSSSQGLGGGLGNTQLNSLVQENITEESNSSDVQQVLEQYLQTPEGQAVKNDPTKLEALKDDLKAILAANNMGLNEAGDVVEQPAIGVVDELEDMFGPAQDGDESRRPLEGSFRCT